ncbi:MAG: diguanylate cyclase [Ilumatobacter sp.]
MAEQPNRNVIAVLTDAFAPFHRLVLDELHPHFAAAGYSTLCITGRDVSVNRFGSGDDTSRERIRSLALRRNVSGVVIVSGATPPNSSEAEVAAFVEGLTDGPAVSLGVKLPGIASTVIRWQEAIDQLIAHMVKDPSRRRFAFVRGYANDPHSAEREAGFRSGLAAAGLDVDERLVVCGNYAAADALLAVDGLLSRGLQFDGVIAANDDMACGAIAALNRHGLSVPDDVIVSGFDDAPSAFTSVPPLTTALLDTPKLAAASAKLLLEAINGKEHGCDRVEKIESRLVVRRSSGVARPTRVDPAAPAGPDAPIASPIEDRWEHQYAPTGLDVDRLALAIVETAKTGGDEFRQVIAPHLNETVENVAWWRHAVHNARQILLDCDPGELSVGGHRAVLREAQAIDRWLRPMEVTIEAEAQSRSDLQKRLIMHLSSCTTAESLWDTLRDGLHLLEMKTAWVTVHDDSNESGLRVAFSLDDQTLDPTNDLASTELLPHGHDPEFEPTLNVLVPLRAGSSDLGYLIVEPSTEQLMQLEAIASGVAQVLRHIDQVIDLELQADQLREANTLLDRLARTDALTGIPNRKLFLECLEHELKRSERGAEIALLYFDLDGFKNVNDTLGHVAGDQLLKMVAERVTGQLEFGEVFARLGGDEFSVLIRDARAAARADDLAAQIVNGLSEPFALDNGTANVTASVGIALNPGADVQSDELISFADAAMYRAKTLGKNRVVHYDRYTTGSGDRPVPLTI